MALPFRRIEPALTSWLVLSKNPVIGERPVGPITDHDVVEDANSEKITCLLEAAGERVILGRRFRIGVVNDACAKLRSVVDGTFVRSPPKSFCAGFMRRSGYNEKQPKIKTLRSDTPIGVDTGS